MTPIDKTAQSQTESISFEFDLLAGMPGWKRDLGKRLDALAKRK